jgi:anaerobic ribonucleoside-triphosphate reductase activating protein
LQNPAHHLRLHRFLPSSRANGPGVRAVVWVQGCSLGCPGCYNPETHAHAGGEIVGVDELFDRIARLIGRIEGLTVSGGEPLQQLVPVLALLRRVRAETPLSTLMFSGYRWDEVRRMPGSAALLSCLDVLIAGRYDDTRRLARGLRGSANKTVHFLTPRYGPADLEHVPPAEVILTADGDVVMSGIDPLKW